MRFFRVHRRSIAYLRFTLEAYDGLATLTTLDSRQGIVALSFPDCFAGDIDGLVAALAEEIGLAEIELPGATPFPMNQETTHDA
ncbi:MAG: DUF4911 domain-containing protein [Geobacteraceae bacterium]|nr:DUF4911 domain-containing protein [Geobacteraceae bacterium]